MIFVQQHTWQETRLVVQYRVQTMWRGRRSCRGQRHNPHRHQCEPEWRQRTIRSYERPSGSRPSQTMSRPTVAPPDDRSIKSYTFCPPITHPKGSFHVSISEPKKMYYHKVCINSKVLNCYHNIENDTKMWILNENILRIVKILYISRVNNSYYTHTFMPILFLFI